MTAQKQISLDFRGNRKLRVATKYKSTNHATIYRGDCIELLKTIPTESSQLIATSPPYNIGKSYEKKLDLETYLQQQKQVLSECTRCLSPNGHICWQVGNFVNKGSIIPLDTVLFPIFQELGLVLRNRIVWHFEHGLHCSKRFSGRYEVIMWLTFDNDYYFNLDPIRVPQKYPGKKTLQGAKSWTTIWKSKRQKSK